MLAEMMKTNYDIYDVLQDTRPPFVFDDPRFSDTGHAKQNAQIPHARGPITLDGGDHNWPGTPAQVLSGKRVVQGPDSGGTEAAFKLCWDEKNLYVLINVTDPTPVLNEHTAHPDNLWNGDGVELFLGTENIEQGGALQFSDRHLVIGATGQGKVPFHFANSPTQYPCETVLIPAGG